MTTYNISDKVFIHELKKRGEVVELVRTPNTYVIEYTIKNEEGKIQTIRETFNSDEISPYKPKALNPDQRKPLSVNIKYFDKNMPRIAKIAVGDLIDLRSRERIDYKKGDSFIIPLGVAMEIPKGWKADLLPRSSTFKKWGLIQTNGVGKIDNSFSGDDDEWGMPVYALKDGVVEKYDRVCQFEIARKMPKFKFNEVSSLNSPSRGGFGSTGTK